MACCLICFSDEPVRGSKLEQFYGNNQQFQIGMMEAPCKATLCCCYGSLCSCCAQYTVRKRALDGNLDNYICCQGYFPGCCCMKPGHCGEKSSPACCLCLESFCCLSCAVSSSRMFIMDKYRLLPDPWDNRIIRFNNALQLLSCICNCLAICVEELREFARILDLIAEIVFYTTVGCMTGQMMHELDYQQNMAPKAEAIVR
ncbi:hypothetical protein JKP88DRAFT_186308 [Tribonema minus]|uniref:PLAC8 family protein n=1 Tax=Tribonema minus TaxID=303371 RepID=A0A835YWZ0_9STRA|nr:hypothetical protein JKP88DRAFT_186308 [Tribonema minus]